MSLPVPQATCREGRGPRDGLGIGGDQVATSGGVEHGVAQQVCSWPRRVRDARGPEARTLAATGRRMPSPTRRTGVTEALACLRAPLASRGCSRMDLMRRSMTALHPALMTCLGQLQQPCHSQPEGGEMYPLLLPRTRGRCLRTAAARRCSLPSTCSLSPESGSELAKASHEQAPLPSRLTKLHRRPSTRW